MKSQINKKLIESLNESNNKEYIQKIEDLVYDLVSSAIENINSPFVRLDKCVLQPANEIYTGAFAQLSEFDFFLGIENPQIEFNSRSRKNFWEYAWREFRAAWRLGRKKYKKKKKKEQEISVKEIEKYKISDFKHDLFLKIVNFLSETSIIYENMTSVSFVGQEDFGTGVKINIYVGVYDSETQTFKLYNEIKNKFITVAFKKRFDYLEFKTAQCGEMFKNMLTIFNSLYSKSYNRIPNQILTESLLFSCPNALFDKDDLYKTFVNVANYICITNPREFVSICDPSKSIFEEPLIVNSNSQVQFSKFVKIFENFTF